MSGKDYSGTVPKREYQRGQRCTEKELWCPHRAGSTSYQSDNNRIHGASARVLKIVLSQ